MFLRSRAKKMDNPSMVDILSKLDEIIKDLAKKATSEEINDLRELLAEKEKRIVALEKCVMDHKNEAAHRDAQILSLETSYMELQARVLTAERRLEYNRVVRDLNSRRIDDHEQISRKVNLKIDGIELAPDENPGSLMDIIKSECNKLNLGLQDSDFDRCHRNGNVYFKDQKKHQSVLLKLCSWRARDVIYQKRKGFPFKVGHDLTKNRREILDYACGTIDEKTSISDVVAFAFADKNCKLKFKTVDDKFYGFSTKEEFLSLIAKISNEQMGEVFMNDEANDELYY